MCGSCRRTCSGVASRMWKLQKNGQWRSITYVCACQWTLTSHPTPPQRSITYVWKLQKNVQWRGITHVWKLQKVPFYRHKNMKKNPQTGPILPRRVDHRAPAIAATNSARGRSMGAQCPWPQENRKACRWEARTRKNEKGLFVFSFISIYVHIYIYVYICF